MSVDIDTLESAILFIFEHLRNKDNTAINLDKDFYWDIESEQKYNPYIKPNKINLGQLSDDWEEIQLIASGEKEAIGYALVWVSALCRYIGETEPS